MKTLKLILAVAFIAGTILALAIAARLLAVDVPAAASGMASVPPAEDVVQQNLRLGKPTVIEFGANACAACREMKPILATLARDYRGRIAVADIDIIKQRQYISRYQIQLMPTQVFYDADGKELGRHMGKISADDILARLGVSPAGRVP